MSIPSSAVTGFHEGERTVQRLAGVDDARAAAASGAIRSYMPYQHREFFASLPFVVAGALDANGQPWTTLMEGPRGFIDSPDEHHLHIAARLPDADPVAALLSRDAKIGLLGIEPTTRRRNRANGTIAAVDKSGISVHVLQSFGNCPKYIQARSVEYVDGASGVPSAVRARQLDGEARAIIANADTFFIASAYSAADDVTPPHGLDVSHRGGRAGVVQIEDASLTVADYVGNNYFNTLGNLERYPLAGLLFIDFVRGTLLHVAARAHLQWLPGPKFRDHIATNRVLHLQVLEMVRVSNCSQLRWGEPSLSPFLR
jgi:predicted pyridoxine 5'-phosphate oxidase superfamily flavin-nucleotide-binding protein